MARVQINNIKKSYGKVLALQDISLDIPSGSFFTLLGPSGCGKTTLLRTIAGFHQQDQGSLLVADKPLDHVPVHKRNIGMVFQDYAIFPHLSVMKNVAFGLKQHRVPKQQAKERTDNILKLVQLENLKQRMPHELSGGQQQRVGLARALVTNPAVLLMDEPLSNLDAQLRVDLRRELKSLQRKLGITTVYVTHDQEEALEMSDFVCVMHNGVVQQSDTPWVIYHQPANRFVASFVGSNNFLPVSLSSGFIEFCGAVSDIPGSSLEPLTSSGVVVSIRPEHVQLELVNSEHASSAALIRFEATVRYHSFAGRELRLTVQALDGNLVQVVVEPKQEYVRLAEGDSVRIAVDKKHLNFYHANDAGLRL
ncbi:MAG: ABC transporter ATP-binding protein [Granulosicoccus sp.]